MMSPTLFDKIYTGLCKTLSQKARYTTGLWQDYTRTGVRDLDLKGRYNRVSLGSKSGWGVRDLDLRGRYNSIMTKP